MGSSLQFADLYRSLPNMRQESPACWQSWKIPDTRVVNRRSIECGINLANFYAGECLRLTEEARVADQLRIADRLRTWLYARGKPMVYLAEIYQRGPSELRSKADAIAAVRILEDHGYLLRLQRGVEIDGCKRDDAWELWREED